MSGLNRVTLLGNLGRDPEIRYTTGGKAVANFSLATNERNHKGEDTPTWHRVVAWEKQAELAGEYLKKGNTVLIEGRIQYREYENKDGHTVKATEIVAHRIIFVRIGEQNAKRGESPATQEDVPF